MEGVGPGNALRLKQRALALAQPLSAHLELTYRCNWRCVFCYNPRHSDLRGLSGRQWTLVLDELRDLGTLTITLTGGEPLTHPDFLDIARAARGKGFALKVFTNGALVTEEVAEVLATLGVVAVELSVHGSHAAVHDRATATPGSFDAMFRGLERLQRRGLPLLLKTPLTALNEADLDAIVALAEKWGVPLCLDPTLTPRDDGDRSPLKYAASPAGVEALYRRVAAQGKLPRVERVAGGLNCGLGRITLAIDPEGNVYPCLQWRTRAIGNVLRTPLAQLWHQSPEREEAALVSAAANAALMAMGGAIASFPYCPALALQKTGDALTPDETHLAHARVVDRIRREGSC